MVENEKEDQTQLLNLTPHGICTTVPTRDEYTLFNLHTTNDDEKVTLDDKRVEHIINNAQRVEALRGIQVASAITSYSSC